MAERAIEILNSLDHNLRRDLDSLKRKRENLALESTLIPDMITQFVQLIRSLFLKIIDLLVPVSFEDEEAFLDYTQTDGTPRNFLHNEDEAAERTREHEARAGDKITVQPVSETVKGQEASSPTQRFINGREEAMKLLKAAAEFNNSDALYLLADMHFYGNYTTPRDYSKAMNYYKRLSDTSGNATAQNMIGFMYSTGMFGDIARDQARALLYHTFAAYGGSTRSEMTLAFRYHAGIGTPRNCEKAVFFYKRVADKAMAHWRSGPPGGRTLDRYTWKLADDHGGVFGEGASESSAGPNSKKQYSTASDSASLEDVLDYLRYMAEKSDLAAQYSLARLFYEGTRAWRRNYGEVAQYVNSRVLERDYAEAMRYFKLVAKQCWSKDGKLIPNLAKANLSFAGKTAGYLGRMYLRGEGVNADPTKAIMWYKLGGEMADPSSLNGLGYMHLKGLGGLKADAAKAAEYFKSAAEQDYGPAQVNLGKLFLEQREVAIATQYFELAARHGHVEAFYYLAETHNQGLGREPSCGMAAVYYKIVAEKVEDIQSPMAWAHEQYQRSNYENALIGFMMAAEQGYESAQANVAYLLDRDKSAFSLTQPLNRLLSFLDSPSEAEIAEEERNEKLDRYIDEVALMYWTRASKQSNVDATVKMGDYYLKGIGTDKDNEKAAACYQAAAEYQQSALALWNLGWMHENGLGVEQDFHLAKRFYDLALTTNTEAYLPVTLALCRLRLRSFWNSLVGGSVNGIGVDGAPSEGEDGESEGEQWKRHEHGEAEQQPRQSLWKVLKKWWDELDENDFGETVPEEDAAEDGPEESDFNYQI